MISSIKKFSDLPRGKQNLELLKAYQQETDSRKRIQMRNHVMELNLGLVRRVAMKLSNQWQDEREFYSEGCLALLDAVEKFDPDRGFQFSTYATTCIRNRLYRLFRKRQRLPVTLPLDEETQVELACEFTGAETQFLDRSRKMVQFILDELPERERELVTLRFGLDRERKPRSYRQVAELVGLSKERVRQLIQQAILTVQGQLVLPAGESGSES